MQTNQETKTVTIKFDLEIKRNEFAQSRRDQATAYVWGREDAGDKQLDQLVTRNKTSFDASWLFSCFAGTEALEYNTQQRTSLNSIQDQYKRFIALLEDPEWTVRYQLSQASDDPRPANYDVL